MRIDKGLKSRIERAVKKEVGMKLSPAEARMFATLLGVQPATVRPKAIEPVLPASKGAGCVYEPVHIRWMIRRDMPVVLRIESESFSLPRGEEEFIRCLRQRHCIGMVAEREDEIIGYMIYELHRTYLQLINICVQPQSRGTGVGHAMIEKLRGKLGVNGRRSSIVADVWEENLSAHLFFRRFGFLCVGTVRDKFEVPSGDTVDAYRFIYGDKAVVVNDQPPSFDGSGDDPQCV